MKAKLLKILNLVLSNNDLSIIDVALYLRNDLGFDSINLAELTVRIEDKFDVDIFENGMVHTIQDICDILNKAK